MCYDFEESMRKRIDKTFENIHNSFSRRIQKVFDDFSKKADRISKNLGDINLDSLQKEMDETISGNGWIILNFFPWNEAMKIIAYEKNDIDSSELCELLIEKFLETNEYLETSLIEILGEKDSIFINKQFNILRLNYRINSIPVLIMLIEKAIISITDNRGKFVKTGRVPHELKEHILHITKGKSDEEREKIRFIYFKGFENNHKIVSMTFKHYEDNKKKVENMGILNRNQIFHGAIDYDDMNEIHFYKLYLILLFLVEVYRLTINSKDI